jgi:hypothetical protein
MAGLSPMIIIARHNEDISWAQDEPHFVVQKGVHLPNVGREPTSFLWYIIKHYDELHGEYEFMQGNPFDHWPYKETELEFECFKDHCNHHPGLPWEEFNAKSGVVLPDKFPFYPGGQFVVDADTIKKHPKEFYQNLYDMIMKDENMMYILERTWGVIFT